MLVEMEPFFELFDFETEDQGDIVVVGGFPIPVERSGTMRLVPLRDVVDAAGLKLSKNPALGTVDVRAADAGTGDRGNWNVKPEDDESSKGTATTLEGQTFKLTVPSHLSVLAEAEYLKAESANAKIKVLNDPTDESKRNKTAFLVSTSKGPQLGLLTFALIRGKDSDFTPANEEPFLNTLLDGIVNRGGTLIGKMKSSNLSGRRFFSFQYLATDQADLVSTNEVYVHFSPEDKVAYLILLSGPKHQFNRVAPQLRLVVRNLRFK